MPNRAAPLDEMPEAGRSILTAARDIIEENGPNSLRVSDVAERAGVAVGLLYHYFDDRDDLIDAVREAQFLARIEADIADLARKVGPDELDTTAVLKVIIDDFSDPRSKKRRDYRLDRMEALAAARYNPELTKRLVQAQKRLSASIRKTIEKAKADGIVAEEVDAHALAFFLEVLPLGTGLATVYADMPSQEAWRNLLLRMFASLIPDKPAKTPKK
ncbi:MAG: TetR/AcrR family transcriptional regulator [Acidobacteria bacterium]|jgi:AcrR family transcriptional regulator|nr:TetR/AcrR family transcriptional regulator [Acidobacteriota bacterium]